MHDSSSSGKEFAMSHLCEACEVAAVEIVEPCDDAKEPYRLCSPCYRRLHARNLRPLEWFNLAKRHGWFKFLLHDDFYDCDGTATQPEDDVENADAFPAPSLTSVRPDNERLLDYSITRWHLEPELIEAWKERDPLSVLSTVAPRFASTSNDGIKAKILSICALTVGGIGADFIRSAWKDYPEKLSLGSLAQASAACLPPVEGYERVVAALASQEGQKKRDQMYGLSYFHSQDSLDWIEQNIFEPITDSWGYLAAASKLDWPRIEAWFDKGRPLSLVAIDALLAITRPMTPLLRELGPSLLMPPTHSRFQQDLQAYRARDPVPRVQQRIDGLLANASQLDLL
jgi:hypothetical protein